MARISCGHCGGTHDSVAAVRACSTSAPPTPAAPGSELPWSEPAREPGAGAGPVGHTDAAGPLGATGGFAPVAVAAVPTTAADLGRLAGPDALGRALLVAPGAAAPAPWDTAERVSVDASCLATPEPVVDALRRAWVERRRVVVEWSIDLPGPERWVDDTVPWAVDATRTDPHEALAHLARTNAVDVRQPDRPRWAWLDAAVAAGATAGGPADVVLPDGRPAWIDGGPLTRFPSEAVDGVAVVPRVNVERGRLTPLGTGGPTADLAPDQLAAVAHPTAAARIIAPAGSGKTRVLTERARHLLRDWGVHPSALCLVAYNRRAADEMRTRTTDLEGLQIRTLNALGLAIVRGAGPYRRRADVSVIDEREVRRHLDGLVTVPRRTNTDPFQPWLDALSAVRLGLRDPAEVEAEYGGDVDGLSEVLPRYRAQLARRGEVDFDEQIVGALEVLRTDPDAREIARRSCRVMLVDEFQDLTPAHLLLVRLLAGPDLAVFGVGDDDQTIYGYAGATPDWLIGYDRLFPGAGDHPLTVNYRCPPAVVEAATHLLARNRRRVPKEIHPDPAATPSADALRVVIAEAPASVVVERVRELVDGGAAPADIAVLTRVNASLAAPQVLLGQAGIAVHGGVGPRWLDRTGVRAALAWLRIAADPSRLRPDDLREAARRPSKGMSNRLLDWIAEKRTAAELRALAERLTTARDSERLHRLADDVERIGRVASRGTAATLRAVRDDIGLDEALASLDSSARTAASSSHLDDLDTLSALAAQHDDLATFEAWLAEQLAVRDDPTGVHLSSVHAVKGREWPHVIVLGADLGLFPHRLADDREEERRVFHVAITRGATSVTVVATAERPSVFLDQLTAPPEGAPLDEPDDAPVDRAPTGPGSRRSRSPAGGRAASTSRSGPATRPAEVGLEIRWGGHVGPIVELADDGARLKLGRATTIVPWGAEVRVDQRWVRLVPPEGADGDADAVEAALRQWRRDRAKADGVPAYVVFNDATLGELALLRPATLTALGRVSGIGPAKLERYGDEILGVVADASG